MNSPVRPTDVQPSRRKSSEDWLDAGLQAFAESGQDGVRVEALARRMNVSKGSFYWHFPNRDALIKMMVLEWEQQARLDLVDSVMALGGVPKERLARFIDIVARRGPQSLERQMRAYAGSDSIAAEAVRRVDISREHFLENTLAACGVFEPQALAFTIYAACLGMMLTSDGRPPEERRRLLRVALDLSIGPLPDVS